jgi:putative tricarboxylic transport membrane protein
MIDAVALDAAFAILGSDWMAWAVMPLGIIIGLIAGAIPGISASVAMVLVLPFTLYMGFLPAILLLTSVFTGASFGCAVPAILMKIPGTPAAVATTFDGFPMTQQGRHNEALGIGLVSSACASAISYLSLFVLLVPLAHLVLMMGSVEMFLVALWGLTLIAALSGKNIVKGLVAGMLGLLIGTVGMSDTGYMRGTLSIPLLVDGVPEVPALMGLFVASQLLHSVGSKYIVEDSAARAISLGRILQGMRQAASHPLIILKGSMIGTVIGVIPGVGSSVSNLISYSVIRRGDTKPESFGTGNPKGLMAAESGNSSSEGGALTTLLALGIPGGGATAIMLSAFTMHNVVGGPSFISEQRDIVYAIILGNFVQTIILIVLGLPFIYLVSRIVRVPMRLLIPSVLSMCALGAYSLTGNMMGPYVVLVFALLGWLLVRFNYPVAATVVGLMLGRLAESSLIRSYQMSGGELSFILERPIAILLAILITLSVVWPLIRGGSKQRAGQSGEAGQEA